MRFVLYGPLLEVLNCMLPREGSTFANEFVTMLPWLMAMGLKGVYANHNESPFEHLFLLALKGLFP